MITPSFSKNFISTIVPKFNESTRVGGIVLDTGYAHRFLANSLENDLFGVLGNVGWAHFRTGQEVQVQGRKSNDFLGSV